MTTLTFGLLLLSASCHGEQPAAEAPSSASLYNAEIELVDQQGVRTRLGDLSGKPVLISMFYASCTTVCPLLIDAVKSVEARLTAEERAELTVVLVSFDPQRDTPAALAKLAAAHKLDGARWKLARVGPAEVRTLAALLGIKYQALPDGSINHSSVITLLDRGGVPAARVTELSEPRDGLTARARELTRRRSGT